MLKNMDILDIEPNQFILGSNIMKSNKKIADNRGY